MTTHRTKLATALAALAALASPAAAKPHQAVPVDRFLDSIGVVSTFVGRGQPLPKTIEMVRYGGFRWVRAGIEGLTDDGPGSIDGFLELHRATGVKLSWGLVSGGTDIARLISTGRTLAKAGALLAFEGNNEPNNWGVVVDGVKGGGHDASWRPVAEIQRRMYATVKADPTLAPYPVWSISEAGAEVDDVGLQYLTIPSGAGSIMPVGTRYADAANLHNYPTRASQDPLPDDLAWNAADTTLAAQVDGVHGNYGETWNKHFKGYAQPELDRLPRVTTETGLLLRGAVDEAKQGSILLDVYLSQFVRGFSHTSVYLLRDRTDEGDNQTFGFFRPDYTPRKAATYLHDMVEILEHAPAGPAPTSLDYEIEGQTDAVHDLLLRSRTGALLLVVWGERAKGEGHVRVKFGANYDVALYDPTIGTAAFQTTPKVDGVDLKLSDHPLVVAITKSR